MIQISYQVRQKFPGHYVRVNYWAFDDRYNTIMPLNAISAAAIPIPTTIVQSTNRTNNNKMAARQDHVDLENNGGGLASISGRNRNKLPNSNNNNTHHDANNHSKQQQQQEQQQQKQQLERRSLLLASFILLVGTSVSGAFLALGVSGAQQESQHHFEKQADELTTAVESTWQEYSLVCLWAHEACHATGSSSSDGDDDEGVGEVNNNNNSNTSTTSTTTTPEEDEHAFRFCSRNDFSELYQYVASGGLDFQALAWIPNITHSERPMLEQDSQAFFEQRFPTLDYQGITEWNTIIAGSNLSHAFMRRTDENFYLPAHYMLPAEGLNLVLTDFDIYSSSTLKHAIDKAFQTIKPTISRRYRILQDDSVYSVAFLHPGIEIEEETYHSDPSALAGLLVPLSTLLQRSVRSQRENLAVYIFDTTIDDLESSEPVFLVGTHINPQWDGSVELEWLHETNISTVRSTRSLIRENEIPVEDRRWSVIVVDAEGSFESDDIFVIVGGVIIFVACVVIALWFYTSGERSARIQEIQAAADAEKAALIVENAEQAALAERQLNNYISHEVRNPLSAAISACSFVSSAVHEDPPLSTKESRLSVQEDVEVIGSSLVFINDLLRSMLDSNRAADNQMKLEIVPTDIDHDILQPVAAILYRRDACFEVLTDCPEHLIVNTDRIRLKQVVLNLANNARKFVQKGFIRLRAEVVNNNVLLSVEDSGPGLPESKRGRLFEKFQESLDSLNQGTGIGLNLCKDLTKLLGGDIRLDESYDSGVKGSPGARFVVDLNTSPIQFDDEIDSYETTMETRTEMDISSHLGFDMRDWAGHSNSQNAGTMSAEKMRDIDVELPTRLSVLFVDDDLILRKLFTRSVHKLAPEWIIKEAASGEAALKLAEDEEFDLIFIDQYMTSVEKQLLGTETARALRSQGCMACLCGLSANDVSKAFLDAGADAFLIKPFPCEKEALTREILRILDCRSIVTALATI